MSDDRQDDDLDPGEREALERSAQRHPWEISLGELIQRLRSIRGLEIEVVEDADGTYLVRGQRICALPRIDRREVLTLGVVEWIVVALTLEWDDLQLDPPDEY